MTYDEAGDVIGAMMAVWPVEWSQEHVMAWFDQLQTVAADRDMAMRVVQNLTVASSFKPSIADFLKQLTLLRSDDAAYRERMDGVRAGEPKMDKALNAEWARRCRDIRRRARTDLDEHDHRMGRTGCPVCQDHDHSPGASCTRCAYLLEGEPFVEDHQDAN